MNVPFPRPVDHGTSDSAQMLGPLPERREVEKAVILAAGRGRRMEKLTADRPKGALEVGGHALIDWQIQALRAAGVKDIAIVTGHGADALAGRDVTYINNPNWKTGTQVETLLEAAEWVGDEPIIVTYSDIIFHPSAPLALLERPGDIVVAYDADHRWLWRRRFGNWLKDSETFRLGPGQVLAEIGGKPTNIEELDGQFMGLMLLAPMGLQLLTRRFQAEPMERRRKLDFTALLGLLVRAGTRIDTAVNLLPWMEIDSVRDLRLAIAMVNPDPIHGHGPELEFPDGVQRSHSRRIDELDEEIDNNDVDRAQKPYSTAKRTKMATERDLVPADIGEITNVIAVQNWGRSGSTFVQSLFDDHPQILSTPNFYSRKYFLLWASSLALLRDDEKIDAFIEGFAQWWNAGLVDATAGLHRLGPRRNEIAGVPKDTLRSLLMTSLPPGMPITRQRLFAAAHAAYAIARGQDLDPHGLQIMYPVHGEIRGVAAALIEDFPRAQFVHTLREPVSNVASMIRHLRFNSLDDRDDALTAAMRMLFKREGSRFGRKFTIFSDRPYFDWLIAADQARALKLEDLHRGGSQAITEVARNLGLREWSGLTRSTWDGKEWWNRPESGTESKLGPDPSMRPNVELLSPTDLKKIEIIARLTRAGAGQYRHLTNSHAIAARLWLILLLVVPWRFELSNSPKLAQRLEAIAQSRLLPERTRATLSQRLLRELRKVSLLRMNLGTVFIRRNLPDESKSAAVRGTLILTESRRRVRIRALASVDRSNPTTNDAIDAVYLDDALLFRSAGDHLTWAFILCFGGVLARFKSFYAVRSIMLMAIKGRKIPVTMEPYTTLT